MIDGYMLRGVWQALNCLFIHATFCVIATGAFPGQTKMKAGVRKNDDFLHTKCAVSSEREGPRTSNLIDGRSLDLRKSPY